MYNEKRANVCMAAYALLASVCMAAYAVPASVCMAAYAVPVSVRMAAYALPACCAWLYMNAGAQDANHKYLVQYFLF